jgi:hypothetical protein
MTFQLYAVLNYLCQDSLLFAQPASECGKRLYYNLLSDKTLGSRSFTYEYFLSIGCLFTTMAGTVETEKHWLRYDYGLLVKVERGNNIK